MKLVVHCECDTSGLQIGLQASQLILSRQSWKKLPLSDFGSPHVAMAVSTGHSQAHKSAGHPFRIASFCHAIHELHRRHKISGVLNETRSRHTPP